MVGRSRFLSLLFFLMKATSLHSPNWSQLQRGSFLIALGQRLALSLFFLGAALLAQPCAATPFQWEYTGSLNIGRRYQSGIATQLLNGKVLVEAGTVEGDAGLIDSPSAELYDPSTGTWTLTGNLNRRRFLHTATLLPDGKVLVAAGADIDGGGYFPIASAELYDPATGTWTLTRPLNNRRFSHTATLLPNGKVLVVGGSNNVGLTSAELYDPASGTWRDTGSLNNGHSNHTATLLPNGMVLVAGGLDSTNHISANADVYNPATGTWTVTGSLNTARTDHTATLLPNGKVLVAGGAIFLASAELYDPATGMWTATGSMATAREDDTATLLPNGQVLVVAGNSPAGTVNSAEIYDPTSGSWAATGSLNTARREHAAILLSNGMVLVAGGADGSGFPLASAELYDPGIVGATHVDGRGTLDNQGNEVTFKFRASQVDDGSKLGPFTFCDPAAGVCIKKGIIRSLSIPSNTADFSGSGRLEDETKVRFTVSVTDNGSPGRSDTISISLDNGYSVTGTLTSGDIRIY